jgi:hypothetical protein
VRTLPGRGGTMTTKVILEPFEFTWSTQVPEMA